MQERGYSLVEVLVVVGIISILLALALSRFTDYLTRSRTENQTRLIYGELLRARADALFQRRAIRVKLYRDHFEIYSSSQDNGNGAAPLETRGLRYPVTCNGTGDGVRGYPLDFDPKGLCTRCSICLEAGNGSGAMDSVVLAATRVSLGIKDRGDACTADNITKR